MKNIKILSPLLFLYIIVVCLISDNNLTGDEPRYIMFANNLAHGFYSPKDDINLWNGPGYPIVLLPFIFLKLPLIAAKLTNAFFLFVATIYFYNTLSLYIHERSAIIYSYLFGFYPPFFRNIHYVITEELVILLVSGFLFHFCKFFQSKNISIRQLAFASFYLCYLALTKIFFGFVISILLIIFLSLYALRRSINMKKTVLVYFIALCLCTPYLFYTYSLTGKIFYWGNVGGEALYWISTPYQDELGDWRPSENELQSANPSKNHEAFFEGLKTVSSIKKDDELKKKAIQNIYSYPKKYFSNWIANIGRIFFNYPYSYTPQKISTFFYMVPNMFLMVLMVLCIYPGYLGRRLIPYEIYALLFFGFISLGGLSLISAFSRTLLPVVPIFSVWIIFSLTRLVKIEIHR